MAVDANKYFRGLRSYLNTNAYEITKRDTGRLILEEKVFFAGGKERKQKVRLPFSGEVIALKLDRKNQNGNTDPLFHFLEDDARPWSKRCDFVIFQLYRNKLSVYCIEFKSSTLPDSLVDQLASTESWCRAVQSIINLYTNEKKRLHLKKFVFSCMDDPSRFVDEEGYIKRDHSVRHYHYDDLSGLKLEELDNQCPVLVG
ncbi:hypothetical protein AB4278_15720 [Vibrio splendidus]